MRKWCCIDAEGDVGDKGLLGVAFYSEDVKEYVTDHDRIKLLLQEHANNGYTFIAHNAGYDLPVIFWQLGIRMEAIYYNGKFNCGRWKYSKSSAAVELWDSVQMSGGLSLADLGRAIGLSKYETPQRLLGIDPDRYNWKCDEHDIWECEQCYAVRDAEIAYKYMVQFESDIANWGCKIKRRLPGNAIEVWKALDKPAPIHIKDKRIRVLAREAYYGGRVETFKIGTITPIYTADVTSMYPYIMQSQSFPDPDHMMYITYPRLSILDMAYEGVAEVDITIPYMHVPPLPIAHNDERVFGYGKVRGSWCLNELRYAVQQGCTITRIHRMAYSTQVLFPFTNYVGTLWEMKKAYKASGDPRELTAKILLNSLYGRLGMNIETNEDDFPAEMDYEHKKQLITGNLLKQRVFRMPQDTTFADWQGCDIERVGDQLWIMEPVTTFSHNPYANVLWAAMITAGARIRLHTMMLMQGSNLVYCDTDSVFSDKPIEPIGEGLGSLRLDGEYQSGQIVAPKLYSLTRFDGDTITKAKGVPRDFAAQFLAGEEVVFKSPIKPLSQMRTGIEAGTWIEVKRRKHLTPHRRQPTNVTAVVQGVGFSETVPLFIGPSGDSVESD